MKARITLVTVLTVPALLGGCSMFGTSLDYAKLTSSVTDTLNQQYAKNGHKVDTVTCDDVGKKPKTGSTFGCVATIAGSDAKVHVKVTVKDKDLNVDYRTTDRLVDLPQAAGVLGPEVTKKVGEPVTVDCGTGVRAIAEGTTFDCTARDATGTTAKLTYTVAPDPAQDKWEIPPS